MVERRSPGAADLNTLLELAVIDKHAPMTKAGWTGVNWVGLSWRLAGGWLETGWSRLSRRQVLECQTPPAKSPRRVEICCLIGNEGPVVCHLLSSEYLYLYFPSGLRLAVLASGLV